MSRRFKTIAIAISLIASLLQAGMIPASDQESGEISVLFILDNSGSMANNDPDNLRYTAAKLFVSLLNEGDAAGALIFANEAHAITNNIERIDSQEGKATLANRFEPVQADGYTDVKAGFTLAQEMLNLSPDRPEETVIIFLTDGKPEPVTYYANYISDTLKLAKSMNIPVLSIALTQGAATSFLTDVAAETGGQVLQANTALDLLDVFLQILGNLKDRTILGDGLVNAPTIVEIPIDEGLIPYINQVSFAVSKSNTVSTTLLDPNGMTITTSDPRVIYNRLDDPNFAIFTLENVSGGIWRVVLEGTGKAQVRGIINASLRAEILSPVDFAEAGVPMLIRTNIVEETIDGETERVIGDASFYAEITTPNGEVESLDRFYDDGSHGDEKADDGIFSRAYMNTNQVGTYTIRVIGTKDLVPIQALSSVTLIPFPEMMVLSPSSIRYSLASGEEIPVEIQFFSDDLLGIDAGIPKAVITDQDGRTQEFILSSDGQKFSALFQPSSSGSYTIDFFVENGVYKGMSYEHTKTLDFQAFIVPRITFDLAKTDLSLGKVERLAAQKGLPLALSVVSTVDHTVTLDASLEGFTGLTLESPAKVTVPSNEGARLTLVLKGSMNLDTGKQEGQLVLTSSEEVNLSGNVIPLSLEIFNPTISVINPTPVMCSDPFGCLNWQSQIVLKTQSTSLQSEIITIVLDGTDEFVLRESEFQVDPGYGEITLTLVNNGWVEKGEKTFNLMLIPERKGVLIGNDPNGIEAALVIPSVLSRCKKLIVYGTMTLMVLILMMRFIIRKVHKATRKPMVTGTLQYWSEKTPKQIKEHNLTEDFRKSSLVVGSDSSCDIQIKATGIEKEHILLKAEKGKGEILVILTPRGEVYQGYTKIIGDIHLQNEMTFKIGEVVCRYLSDSGY